MTSRHVTTTYVTDEKKVRQRGNRLRHLRGILANTIFPSALPAMPDDWEFNDDDLNAELDEAFPLGDGVADLSTEVSCPYCGEPVEIALDPGSGSNQQYIEDCAVCCRPWHVTVVYDETGHADVFVDASDDQ